MSSDHYENARLLLQQIHRCKEKRVELRNEQANRCIPICLSPQYRLKYSPVDSTLEQRINILDDRLIILEKRLWHTRHQLVEMQSRESEFQGNHLQQVSPYHEYEDQRRMELLNQSASILKAARPYFCGAMEENIASLKQPLEIAAVTMQVEISHANEKASEPVQSFATVSATEVSELPESRLLVSLSKERFHAVDGCDETDEHQHELQNVDNIGETEHAVTDCQRSPTCSTSSVEVSSTDSLKSMNGNKEEANDSPKNMLHDGLGPSQTKQQDQTGPSEDEDSFYD